MLTVPEYFLFLIFLPPVTVISSLKKRMGRFISRIMCLHLQSVVTLVLLLSMLASTHAVGFFCSLFHGECRTLCDPSFYNRVNVNVSFICGGVGGKHCCVPITKNLPDRRLPSDSGSQGGKLPYRRIRYQSRPTRPYEPAPPPPPAPPTGPPDNGKYVYGTTPPPDVCGLRGHSRVRRVVNGVEAGRCRYPWMALIVRGDMPWETCGAALVSNQHLITAAHCFDLLRGRKPSVVVGEYNRNEVDFASEFHTNQYSVTVHPRYSSWSYRNDIAVVTLATPIDLSLYQCLRPICLPAQDFILPVGFSCVVAGWGSVRRDSAHPKASTVLREAPIPVVAASKCQEKWRANYFPESHICAGDLSGKQDSCGGDSGGPLMCRDASHPNNVDTFYLFGVVSLGNQTCAQPDVPALYTNVRNFLPWISSIIRPQ